MSRFANGGYIPSSGDPDDDRIPFLVSRDYVWSAALVRRYGEELLEELNAPSRDTSEETR